MRLGKNTFLKNVAWLIFGQGAGVVLQALYFICLARLLGKLEYGVYAGVVALTSIISQYSSLGTGIVLLRYVSPDHTKLRQYWGNLLVITIGIGALMALCLRLFGASIAGNSGIALIIPVAIGDCVCAQFTLGVGQAFQALEEMKTTATLNLITNFLRLLVAVLMLSQLHHTSAGQWAWASMSISAVAAIAAFVIVTRRSGLPIFRPRLFFRHFKEGIVYSISGSTTSVYNDLDKTMLSHWGMTAANGIYTMAYRIVDICTIPVRSMQAAALPRFFQTGSKGTAQSRSYALKILKRTAPMGLLAALAAWLGAPLLPRIVGSSFAESVTALRWLCLIPFLRSFHLSAGDAITGAGFQTFRLGSQLTASALNFGMNLYLIPKYGWLGAAWASLLTDGSMGTMNWIVLQFLVSSKNKNPTPVISQV